MIRRALVCWLLASSSSTAAAQTHVWLSPSRQSAGGGPGVPTLAYYNGPGAPEENVFYVWVRPQTDASDTVNVDLTQVSLAVRSEIADAIEFRAVEVDNPVFGTTPGSTVPIRRFEYAAASIDGDVSVEIRSNPDFIADFGGFSLFEDDAEGIGLGLQSLSMGDSLYDPASVAFRFATIVIEAQAASSTTTDIYLQVGNPGMANEGGQADGHMVVLGDPNDPPLDAGASNETDSLTADAVIRLTSLPADFDADLDVDGADLEIWQRNYSTMSQSHFQFGDATFDGVTDGEDLLEWQRFHGESMAAVQSAPEPGTLILAVAIVACWAMGARLGCAERREARHWFPGGVGGRVCSDRCLRLVAPHLHLGKGSIAWLVNDSNWGAFRCKQRRFHTRPPNPPESNRLVLTKS